MSDGAGTTLSDDTLHGWDGMLQDGGPGVPGDGQPAAWVSSTVPLVDPDASRVTRYFPQFGDGQAGRVMFQSSLILANAGAATAWITLEFFRSPDGTPLEVSLDELGTDSIFEFGLRKGESISLTTPGTGELKVGYLRAIATEEVGLATIFERTDSLSGLSMYETGVPCAMMLNDFSIIVDSLGDRDTGLAVVYPKGNAPPYPNANLRFRLYDQQFNLIGEVSDVFPAGSHFARYVYQLFDDPQIEEIAREMQGILVVTSDQPVAAVTFRQKDDPAREFPLDVPILTTFPVIPGAPE